MGYYSSLLHGEILLAENRPKQAIAVCNQQSPRDFTFHEYLHTVMKDVLARAYYQNGEIDKAIEEYENLIILKSGQEALDLIQPRYYYRLAKLSEEKGLKDKAIQRYEKFLDIWKDADEDRPEPHDARKRLAKLKE